MPHIKTSAGPVYWSKGNSKVAYPIFNVGSGTDCASRAWCPFDRANHKRAGRALCYAQATDAFRPNVLASRRMNQHVLATLGYADLSALAEILAERMAKVAADGIVRINEAGDLSAENIGFVCALAIALKARGVRMYGYSKAPMALVDQLRAAGATILQSERQFIAAPTVAEGEATGLARCPGQCGPCSRCPDGQSSWILEH